MANTTWLYRVMETDEDGDPYDFGVVRAASTSQARRFVEARLKECTPAGEPLTVKLYPLKDQATGVLGTHPGLDIVTFPFDHEGED
jgi:hypothetical protein